MLAVNPTALETPGPGHYTNTRVSQHPNDMVQQVIEFARSSRVHFGSFSKRETDVFLKRDPTKSPFKNSTGNESPAPGQYNPKKPSFTTEEEEQKPAATVKLSPKRIGRIKD